DNEGRLGARLSEEHDRAIAQGDPPARVGFDARVRVSILTGVPNEWIRRRYVCAAALSAMLVAPVARADLRITWDCYLPSAGVDCAVLESSLTSKIPFLKIVSARGDPDVFTTVTSLPSE